MAKSQIRYGSQGADVKELQKALNQNGYKLNEDGIFGANTLKAVKDYQQKNKLTVDGIVGNQTWNAVLGLKGTTQAGKVLYNDSQPTTSTNKNTGFTFGTYEKGEDALNADAALEAHLAAKPTGEAFTWQDQLDDVINKLNNREKFSYDLNGDALYQQYKDKYIQQGKMAMGDAIGQASAMTGGYGNSYAQSVGQQAYQAQLQNLNDIVPELYQLAYDKYKQEGQDLYNQYSMLAGLEEQNYNRNRDALSDWMIDRDYWTGRSDTLYDRGYKEWSDQTSLEYQDHINAIANEQWQAQFDEGVRQFDEQMAFNEKQYNDSKASNTKSGGTSSPNSTNKGSLSNQPNKALGVEGGSENKIQPTQTKNTTAIINRHQTKSEYLARGHSEKEYLNYMESNIAGYLRDGRITEEEALYLIQYYGIQ